MEYPILVLLAAGIGLVLGFVVVPWRPTPDPRARFRLAVRATSAALSAAAEDRATRGQHDDALLAARLGAALRTQRELLNSHPRSETHPTSTSEAVQRAAAGLRALTAAAAGAVLSQPGSPQLGQLEAAREHLDALDAPPPAAPVQDALLQDADPFDQLLLAGTVLVDSAAAELIEQERRTPPPTRSADGTP